MVGSSIRRCALLVALATGAQFSLFAANDSSQPVESRRDDPASEEAIPYSDLASPQARNNYMESQRLQQKVSAAMAVEKLRPGETEVQRRRRVLDEQRMIPELKRLRQLFAVNIEPVVMGGVQTDVVTPAGGIAHENRHRVLINLHGGGMSAGARYGGQQESVPVASIGRVKVITIDYRMAPENHYPAAEEDVESVYRELLKDYRAENIGIFGCSAGAYLTGSSVAWFLRKKLPRPGALGMFGQGPFGGWRYGDSYQIYHMLAGKPAPPNRAMNPENYWYGFDRDDPDQFPSQAASIQSLFPPSLFISGTRDIGLSQVVYSHALLVERGVEADLHIWEGAEHCSFAQLKGEADVPENWQAWKVIVRFFDKHLGKTAR